MHFNNRESVREYVLSQGKLAPFSFILTAGPSAPNISFFRRGKEFYPALSVWEMDRFCLFHISYYDKICNCFFRFNQFRPLVFEDI